MKKTIGITIIGLLILSMVTAAFSYSPFGFGGNMMPSDMNQRSGLNPQNRQGMMGQGPMDNQSKGERPSNETFKIYLLELVDEGIMTSTQYQSLVPLLDDDQQDPIKTAIAEGIITDTVAKALGQKLHGSTQSMGDSSNRFNNMGMSKEPFGQNNPQNTFDQSNSQNNFGPPSNMESSLTIEAANTIADNYLDSIGYYPLENGYPIVGTNQTTFFSNNGIISEPQVGEDFYGQDATYSSNGPSYLDNGDGTVTDLVTGLMWQQDPGDKMTWEEAIQGANDFELAGYDDWRLPTIKELYSLMQFSGNTGRSSDTATPYLDSNYFVFTYGDATGERYIDSQYASSTIYDSGTMTNNSATMFGVNFADGRIKGYPASDSKEFYVMYVRGNTSYGENLFVDNEDGTVTDEATNLMWMTSDSGLILSDGTMDWESALEWAENLEYAGYDDWRLPDAKELQSIVDYDRSPDSSNSAAIDPMFEASSYIDFDGEVNYPYYWSSTTHQDGPTSGSSAVYVSFGETKGYMNDTVIDAHGAGAQRSDPKTGDREDYPSLGNGPQGDVRMVFNYVKLVRDTN